jgi:hypothetical protein
LQSPEDEQTGSNPQVAEESTEDTEARCKLSRLTGDTSRCQSESAEDYESSGPTPAQSRRTTRKSHYVAPPPVLIDEKDRPAIVPHGDR